MNIPRPNLNEDDGELEVEDTWLSASPAWTGHAGVEFIDLGLLAPELYAMGSYWPLEEWLQGYVPRPSV